MRVVETDTTPTYKMGKNRKHRLRKKNEGGGSDSSEEGAAGGATCTHINKAVNLTVVRKAVSKPTAAFGECGACTKDKGPAKETTTADGPEALETETETTIWVCLQCFNQGCDRNSKEKHALAHYETPHSGTHCVVVNLTSWAVWCYACDEEIILETSKRIQECVDMLRKMAGLPRVDQTATGRRGRADSTVDLAAVKDNGRPTTPKATVATSSCQKVKGLSNLGNTCFFNAVMQNLSQTHSLESILCDRTKKGRGFLLPGRIANSDSDTGGSSDDDSEDDSLKEISPIEIVPPDAGPLTQAMMTFLQDMNHTAPRNMTVNPSGLFGQVCKKAPRFKGFQQQDSHELLRYLLDVIRTEEVKRGQMGILKYFKLQESTNPKKVDDDTKVKVKEYGRQVKHTFLDSVFGGQLVSTVMCEECKHVSQIFEPFLDLSLPVTEEKPQRPNLILGGRKKESMDTEEVKGVEGGVTDKPTKHVEKKKNKKQARKEAKAKRRGAKLAKQKSWTSADDLGGKDEVGGEERKMSVSVEKVREDDGDDSQGSGRDDQSDADIEDNLESDTSRLMHAQQEGGRDVGLTEDTVDSDGAQRETVSGRRTDTQTPGQPVSVDTDVRLGHIAAEEISPDLHVSGGVCTGNGDIKSHSQGMASSVGECGTSIAAVKTDVSSLGNDLSGLTFADQSETEECDAKDMCVDVNSAGRVGPSPQCKEVGQYCARCQHNRGAVEQASQNTDILLNGNTVITMNGEVEKSVINGVGAESEGVKAPETEGSGAAAFSALDDTGQVSPEECDSQLTLKGESEDTLYCQSPRDLTECTSMPSTEEILTNGLTSDRLSPNQAKHKVELRKQAQYKSMNSLAPRYHPAPKECSIMSCLHQFTSAELLTGSNKFGCKQCTKTKRNKTISQQKDKKTSETVYSNASKQYHIFLPPSVLTLHLKRFEQVGFTSRKVNRHVDFPFVFDLAPYCSALCQGIRPGQKKILYALYGVVEHSGRLSGGHYTAYVKVRPSLAALTNYLNSQVPTPKDYVHQYAHRMLNGPRSPTEEDLSDETLESLVPPGKWYHVSDSRVSEVQEATVQRAQAYLLFYERIY
ncbi:ubiquitin carboxyl-terminal hydrolase 45-like isoform X2 [Haliotis rufescens]|uniref:ubiquitin carboxyl-terminal hydrolase 45-like isoform X2 n=1 Tax=Haliotis rufescens TaxID=6454 RepID=UPI00201FAC30|nr:ubiquitin carboxyl-terminal hydrolase 45-like isoform X2 [Haliotis rufescens]